MKTEKICMETWLSETKCECIWETGPNRQNSRKKRFDMNIDNTGRRLFDMGVETLPDENNINQWRHQKNISTDSEPSLLANGDDSDDEYKVGLQFVFTLF